MPQTRVDLTVNSDKRNDAVQCVLLVVSITAFGSVSLLVQVPLGVPEQAQATVSQANGGYVSLTILPRHVKDTSLDDLVWSLLTFHEYIQYHVKCFKVSLHQTMLCIHKPALYCLHVSVLYPWANAAYIRTGC